MKAKSYGFTIVELLVVVGMLSVLAAGLLATLDPIAQLQKGWDTQRKSDLAQIQKALEVYYQDTGRFPSSSEDQKILRSDSSQVEWGEQWIPYMTKVPKDPRPGKKYIYYSDPDGGGQSYLLYASLDRGIKDPQSCGGRCPTVQTISALQTACEYYIGGDCTYGVSSSNARP